MDTRLIALKLVLDELGAGTDIQTIERRKAIQKAVYLAQRAGINFGYRFSWYLMGPYSTSLTRDYYDLAYALDESGGGFEERKLVESARQRLAPIKSLVQPPTQSGFQQADWLELVASLHYLRTVSGKDDAQARAILNKEKPRLHAHVDLAENSLIEAGLLPRAA